MLWIVVLLEEMVEVFGCLGSIRMLAFLFMLLKTLHKTSAMGSWQTFTPSLYLLNLLIMVMLFRTSTSIPYRIAGKQM